MIRSLEEGLEALGLPYSVEQADDCRRFLEELTRWNRAINLVGDDEDLFLTRHLLDSLSALPVLRELPVVKTADVGSGGGFPGIPLSIFLPGIRMTLIERSEKKAGFLRVVRTMLSCRDRLEILREDIRMVRDEFDLVVTRGFASLESGASLLWPRIAPGGSLVFYKGRIDRIETELAGLRLPVEPRIIPLYAPFSGEERNLVVFTRSQ